MAKEQKRGTSDYFIFDVETGGRDHKKNAVCEIAAILLNGQTLEEIERYETVIKPYDNKLTYEAGAEAVHGLSIETLEEHGEEASIVVDEIIEILERANQNKKMSGKVILVGHNVSFDIGFINQLFSHAGKKLTDYTSKIKDFDNQYYPEFIDTIKLAHLKWANEPMKFGLGSCCEKAEVVLTNAHAAMDDVEATTELFRKFVLALRSLGDQIGGNNFKDRVKFSFT